MQYYSDWTMALWSVIDGSKFSTLLSHKLYELGLDTNLPRETSYFTVREFPSPCEATAAARGHIMSGISVQAYQISSCHCALACHSQIPLSPSF